MLSKKISLRIFFLIQELNIYNSIMENWVESHMCVGKQAQWSDLIVNRVSLVYHQGHLFTTSVDERQHSVLPNPTNPVVLLHYLLAKHTNITNQITAIKNFLSLLIRDNWWVYGHLETIQV